MILESVIEVIGLIFTAIDVLSIAFTLGASVFTWITYLWFTKNVLRSLPTVILIIATGYGSTRIYKQLHR